MSCIVTIDTASGGLVFKVQMAVSGYMICPGQESTIMLM